MKEQIIKLNELEEWFNDLRYLILDTHICISNGRRVSRDENENEKKLKEGGFFYHYQLQQVFIMSIQLCKILCDNTNQKRNVFKLFRVIENQTYDDKLEDKLNCDVDYIAKSRAELVMEINRLKGLITKNAGLIERLKEVRDTAYAHYDPDRKQFGLSLLEYQELVNLAGEVYNGLHLKIFGSTTFFEHTVPWDIDPIIRRASKAYSDMIKDRQNRMA